MEAPEAQTTASLAVAAPGAREGAQRGESTHFVGGSARRGPAPRVLPGPRGRSEAGGRSLRDTPPLPLLATKLALRLPSAALVSRPGLTARLQPTPIHPVRGYPRLAVVVALAGSGKSSLLGQWCQQHGEARVAWLSLDANDNEPTRFLLYLCAALETLAPEATGSGRALLESPHLPPLDHALTLLLDGLAARQEPVPLVSLQYTCLSCQAPGGCPDET
jgi:hypothetical protein